MKFAQIGYGHGDESAVQPNGKPKGGRGKGGYTYLVSDNIRKEDILQVISHSPRGRAFPTTGQVLTVHKNAPKDPNGQPVDAPKDLTTAYNQRELGVTGVGLTRDERTAQARQNALSVYNVEKYGGITGKEAESKFAITGGTKTERLMNEGYESYAQYIERTKPWGDNQ